MPRSVLLPALVVLAVGCFDNVTLPERHFTPPVITVTGVSPNLGSTGGDTPVIITGTGFQSGLVTIGGITVSGRFDHRDRAGTTIYLETPPHAAGTVDLVVTDADGQVVVLAGGYTYATPESFDFNGNWGGFGNAGQDIPLGFTIQNQTLVSVWCDSDILTLSTPPSVTNGEFSYSTNGVLVVSGRIVSASAAVGTIDFAACTATSWVAGKP